MKILTLLVIILLNSNFVHAVGNIGDLLRNTVQFTNNILIPTLIGIAFLIFIINVFRFFIVESTEEDGREKAKNLAIYSVFAFVLLFIFWGIVNILVSSSGLSGCSQVMPDYIATHFVGPSQPACP